MFKSPIDAVKYIVANGYESAFMNSLMYHKQGFTIGEITDREYARLEEGFFLKSQSYSINLRIEDDDVLTALHNGLYVSSFISRKDNEYQVHFLCHQYPTSMKARFDDEILAEVLQYMILKTVVALRLDSEEKINSYMGIKK